MKKKGLSVLLIIIMIACFAGAAYYPLTYFLQKGSNESDMDELRAMRRAALEADSSQPQGGTADEGEQPFSETTVSPDGGADDSDAAPGDSALLGESAEIAPEPPAAAPQAGAMLPEGTLPDAPAAVPGTIPEGSSAQAPEGGSVQVPGGIPNAPDGTLPDSAPAAVPGVIPGAPAQAPEGTLPEGSPVQAPEGTLPEGSPVQAPEGALPGGSSVQVPGAVMPGDIAGQTPGSDAQAGEPAAQPTPTAQAGEPAAQPTPAPAQGSEASGAGETAEMPEEPDTATPSPTPDDSWKNPTAPETPVPTDRRYRESAALPYDQRDAVELDEDLILPQYREIYGQNEDLVGWLYIPGTPIDYPVLQSEVQDYYLRRDFYGRSNENGQLILDHSCDPWTPSYNLVISGHNMKNGTMFGSLANYASRSYWRNHKTLTFDTLMREGTYVVFAAFYSADYDVDEEGFRYNADIQYRLDAELWLEEVMENREYDTGIDVEFGDEILTLTTCLYQRENGRFVVVARRVRDGEVIE